MTTSLKALSLALGLTALSAAFMPVTHAQNGYYPQSRAYASEDPRRLNQNDQVRVISQEYADQSGGRRIPDDQMRFYLDQINRSNWGFSQVRQDIAQSIHGGGQPGSNGTIRCDSNGSNPSTCRTPWPGQSRLVRTVSDAKCVEGRSWQSQPGQISVSHGCRAEFAEAPRPVDFPGQGRAMDCESAGSRHNACTVPWGGPSRLQRQLSKAKCVEGRSWGSGPGQVWVSRGCRGQFTAAAGFNGVPAYGGDYAVTCISVSGMVPTTCAWDRSRGQPYLLQQLSGVPCIDGQTWGYSDRNGLWVSRGCRARFGDLTAAQRSR
jgi:hypothetical protein